MTVTVRFAPSPTGRLHAGNIRTAIINALFARKAGGTFILRLDDTDKERSTEAFARGIEEDIAWLGIEWSEKVRQSDRLARYDAAVEKLKEMGRLYPAYETPEELELKRKRQLARGKPPVYDRAALELTDEDKAALEAEGRKPHWRFKLEPRDVVWEDLVRGRQHVDAGSLSDPVLIRGDGTFLYTLPSVVDDIDLGVTHVIRGEDHVANTAPQIQLFEALSAKAPDFGHHNLLVGAEGQALSKRDKSLSIQGMREEGLEPLAVVSYAATIGTSDPIAPHDSLDVLAEAFDFGKLSRAPARFDPHELGLLNAKLLHTLPFSAVADRLAELGVTGGEAFWDAVRGNLEVLKDAKDWWTVVTGPIEPVIDDPDFCAAAVELLPLEPWDEETWGTWTGAVKAETGAKGKALFQPLRLALTGQPHGPELKQLLPLIGRERALKRLRGEAA
ncbi:glutamate--tRNA ligase [Methyloceanibacter caenitepidi]|uniref:Glutamate--tRNA ligase n=1 Tax=Methyloceanibacter caenitepidi TaxID=1384459 RepID=A0A0A8K581_9HYPH|nr:glutamate--tRNA ligase [Methyloceanibacter caenitepidi]BAQ17906.1 glutamyl-tRNA(Gln) synthetase [Methyloceanibacter caenitepidi]